MDREKGCLAGLLCNLSGKREFVDGFQEYRLKVSSNEPKTKSDSFFLGSEVCVFLRLNFGRNIWPIHPKKQPGQKNLPLAKGVVAKSLDFRHLFIK